MMEETVDGDARGGTSWNTGLPSTYESMAYTGD